MRFLLTLAVFAGYFGLCRYVVTNAVDEIGIVATLIGVAIFWFCCYRAAVVIDRRDRKNLL